MDFQPSFYRLKPLITVTMKIQILGSGCSKCSKLAELTDKVAQEMNLDYELEKVSGMAEIMSFGVMTTPAIAVDGKVMASGRLPSAAEIKQMLTVIQL